MVLFVFLITSILGVVLFKNWPAGFNTPQISPQEFKHLENIRRRTLHDEQLRVWSIENMNLPEGMRKLPPKPLEMM